MADFDWVESAGTTIEEEPRISASRFGDGYEERAPDGLNPLRQRWSLTFRSVEKGVADDIVAFLRARLSGTLGLESFTWTPLWATTPISVVCRRWSRSQGDIPSESEITAVFEQEFAP